MADDRQSARRGPEGPADTADSGAAGQNRDAFAASDENELLDEDAKNLLEDRRRPLKDLDPEQVGK
ncbi:hypothetical protein [Streptomyces sp. NPDC002044]|uniref:hypothetical protein n=1 Tax=Streptomyces sp. NPDC002044 TaxID=3154662 RepID=UPI00332EA761